MITEHNPIMRTLNDQFAHTFCEPQDTTLDGLKKITECLQEMQPHMQALGDGLRHPTDEELLDRGSNLGQELSALHRVLKYKVPTQFDAAIEENIDLLHDVLNNLAGIRMNYYLTSNTQVCECGKCDSCVAGQSDAAYERKRDRIFCDEN